MGAQVGRHITTTKYWWVGGRVGKFRFEFANGVDGYEILCSILIEHVVHVNIKNNNNTNSTIGLCKQPKSK